MRKGRALVKGWIAIAKRGAVLAPGIRLWSSRRVDLVLCFHSLDLPSGDDPDRRMTTGEVRA